MSNTPVNMNDMSAKLQQLQNQVMQLNQMQEQAAQLSINKPTAPAQPMQQDQPMQSTYPKTIKTDTVEDILNNPQWRKELQAEFAGSELGRKASTQAEMLFIEFCEIATGKPSVMLNNLRAEARPKPAEKPVATEKPVAAAKKPDEKS